MNAYGQDNPVADYLLTMRGSSERNASRGYTKRKGMVSSLADTIHASPFLLTRHRGTMCAVTDRQVLRCQRCHVHHVDHMRAGY